MAGVDRRGFLRASGLLALGLAESGPGPRAGPGAITLFVCGDVMPGRGIDQVLPHPSGPRLYEPYVRSAVEYVELAERASGRIPRPVDYPYMWGDGLAELAARAPDLRLVNLETAVTTSESAWPHKGIHYRMHPENVACLTAAGTDGCVLANNHVLDWGYAGLAETVATLRRAGLATAGAGRDRAEAAAPAVLAVPGKGRVLVFAWGHASSGVPPDWAAGERQAGVNWLPDLSEATVGRIAGAVRSVRRPGDLAVASLHWGGNWGYAIPEAQRRFARGLVEAAGIDLVWGHSSHHPRGLEVHRGRPILYGCGDLINDYEGISGYEAFRGDLALMYFVRLDAATGRLERLDMVPFRMRRFRLNRASARDAEWLRETLDRECARLGCRVVAGAGPGFELRWAD